MELQQIIQMLTGLIVPFAINLIKKYWVLSGRGAQWLVFALAIVVVGIGALIKGGFDWSDPVTFVTIFTLSEASYRQIWKDFWKTEL